ncbi:sugar phosphate isomerase/epimerase family protein [Listeria ivanovii]|uniref:sugar phosphate isomerase/epimerase family protein n=1 Tax=Listeria ivanovii TaxID=1638 RepID=UPI0003ECB2C3|nr:sugar phosphate isomerase/epimerase [Listeria ivanovii]AHI56677.1 sugar phosphate isomerase [Listeria ivanovii WSLC3009]AIS66094.1 sugar phosphate isomerase [Listeria ivanovii subsp. ivanovii]QDA71336.1 sugar phosphate isomerase/epimerase [Listeria ivanovii]SNV47265.1 Xylose isomerase-like TIM barrel [Listeria ivanovii subsp. ivanovii]SNV97445.1 Xylose isomerase-like TIM barrel [Listeria ivanovii subsp. ivanovii]
MQAKIALQLWSVKEACELDFFGTLEKVAEMGYDGVEFAGYYGKSAHEIKAKLAELGLEVAGSHISKEQLEADLDNVILFEKELGNRHIVCPYADFETEEEWFEFSKQLQVITQTINEAGLALSYHNHAHELERLSNQTSLEMLLENVPGMNVELDTYWLEYAGVGVIPFIEKYQQRLPLVHIKDRSAKQKESTIIGEGVLDIQGYITAALNSGSEWLIIEQEAFEEDPLISVSRGRDYLASLLEEK